jgi:hypothetical protein
VGNNLTLYGSTLAVLSTPTFIGINCTTLGTQNTICGTSAGSTLQPNSADNALFGYQAGFSITSGSQNVAVGSQAMGNTGVMIGNGQNVAVGYQSLYSLTGATLGNVAIGGLASRLITTSPYNVSVGTLANSTLVTGSGYNVAIGTSSGFTIPNSTGSYCTYIGTNANPSSPAVIGELVMSNTAATVTGKGASTAFLNYSGGLYVTGNIIPNCNTTSNCYIGNSIASSTGNITNEGVINVASGTATGRGANTMLINATAGLYYWNPAICYLYATGLSNGWIQWATWDTNNVPTKGFTLTNNDGRGANTTIEPNVYGHYEITINGAMLGNGSNLTLTMNNLNVRQYNIWYQSFSVNGIAYSLSATAFARPYIPVNLTGFEFQLNNMTIWGGLPLFACIKFIGF